MDPSRWPPGSLWIVMRLVSGAAHAHDIVRWAVDALEAGFSSPALVRLAAFAGEPDPDLADAEPLLRTAVGELGLPFPADDEIRLTFLEERAAAIVDGADLDAELDDIHAWVVTPLDHREDVEIWCRLWERLDPDPSADDPLSDADIRRLAQDWLQARRSLK